MIIIGIDPGVTGAVAIRSATSTRAYIMPVVYTRRGKSRHAIIDGVMLREVLAATYSRDVQVYIEKAQAMIRKRAKTGKVQKQGSVSAFNYGKSAGIIEGIVIGLRYPYLLVRPMTWRKSILRDWDKADPKGASIIVAKQLFPEVSLRRSQLCKKDDHNMADALLLTEFGHRMMQGTHEWRSTDDTETATQSVACLDG